MNSKKKARLTFGLIVNRVIGWEDTTYYQSKILSGVEDYTGKNDINLICFITGKLDTSNEWERKKNILFNLVNKKLIDGLIISGAVISKDSETQRVSEFMNRYRDIPTVFLNSSPGEYPFVCVDNHMGMRQIVDHIVDVHGCRKIAFLKGPEKNTEAQERFQAYKECLEKHGIPFNPDLVYVNQDDFNFTSGVNAMTFLLDEKKAEFDAIVASNDNIAAGALTELYRRTGEISRNIPVTGFDDSDISKVYYLTTVRQSFHEQTRLAVNMLFRLISGEEIKKKEETPSELIIRSSCGCVSGSLMKSSFVKYDLTDKNFGSAFQKGKYRIYQELSELNLSVDPEYRNELFELEKKLLDALNDEADSALKQSFLNSLNNIVLWMTAQNINTSILQEVISVFRKNILLCFSGIDGISAMEALFHASRIHLEELTRRIEANNKIMSYSKAYDIDVFGEKLISTLDFKSQMDILYKELPKYGVKGCYISLYENPAKPLEYSKLVLAYNENSRTEISGDGLRYPTQDFLPGPTLKKMNTSRFASIVQALHDGDTQLGYAVFDYGSRLGNSFEYIRDRISFALKNALMIDEIRKQAQSLENQVKARTKELSHANRQLKKEIGIRRGYESKLKKAMDELELYNRKLYNQSLRDELTGLYNRRGFMEFANHHYQIARNQGKGLWVVYADMDGLKKINDKYGHKEGDYAIKKTAEIISRSFRNMDIVARLGGDEFTVIVVDSSLKDEESVRSRLNRAFMDYNKEAGKAYKLSISIGAVYFDPSSPVTFEELLMEADKSLYNQKHRERQCD